MLLHYKEGAIKDLEECERLRPTVLFPPIPSGETLWYPSAPPNKSQWEPIRTIEAIWYNLKPLLKPWNPVRELQEEKELLLFKMNSRECYHQEKALKESKLQMASGHQMAEVNRHYMVEPEDWDERQRSFTSLDAQYPIEPRAVAHAIRTFRIQGYEGKI